MADEPRKRSWSEIDQMRIRGQKFEKKTSKLEERAQKQASSAAKKELESLFSTSKVSKDKKEFLEKIQNLRGKPDYYKELTHYREKFGVPLELDIQMLFLDHRDSKIVIEVLDEIKRTAPKLELEKQSLLSQKLKVIALSTFDPQIADKIKEIEAGMLRV